MNPKKPEDDRLAYHGFRFSLSGLTMTRVILWLVAITIVSFVIGFSILAFSGDPALSPGKTYPFRQTALGAPNTTGIPLDGASAGRVTVSMGAGQLSLRGGAGPGQLVEATAYSGAPVEQPAPILLDNGTVKTATVNAKITRGAGWFAGGSPNHWQILVCDEVPVDLTVEIGAGHSELDLGALNLSFLSVSNGAGETTVDLTGSRAGPVRAEIHNGVGELRLKIDQDTNTRIRVHSGVGDVTADGFVQNDETYTTAGFNPASPVREISIAQGVGSIQLEAV